MVSDLDQWRAAEQLISAHGEHAIYQAGVLAAAQLKQGSLEGFNLWQAIALKIDQLQQSQIQAS